MADKRDYYEVLGISKDADDAQIKSAFRKAAKTCHPDLHPNDKEAEARFKELNEAYEVLSDPDKRAKYDQYGFAAFDPSMGGGNPFSGGQGFGGFDDIISSFFGGGFGGSSGRTNNGPVQGEDQRYSITLTFEEAAFGVEKEFNINREEQCEVCAGTGAKAGTSPVRCPTCNGTGQVRSQQNTILGSFMTTKPCAACGGTGKYIKEPCTGCRGKGRVRKNAHIRLKVPAGIDDGQTINMRGEGDSGLRGGPRGNLYVTVAVKPHKQFTRKGNNLLLQMDVSYPTMVLGGEIEVPTLKEKVKYSIPAGTQNKTTFRLREQGIPFLNGNGKGDLLVTVVTAIPTKLTDQQRSLLQQLAASFGEECKQGKSGKSFKNIFKS